MRRGPAYFYVVLLVALVSTSSLVLIEGVPRIFGALASLALALTGLAFVMRRIRWVWLLPAVLALFVAALIIDEWRYLVWTVETSATERRLTKAVQPSQANFNVGELSYPPDRYIVKPQQMLLLHFEPPWTVWTYHLCKTRIGPPCVETIFGVLRSLFWSRSCSWEVEELAMTHTAWNIGVVRCTLIAACSSKDDPNEWIIYSEHGHGF
jgi:hypothetical protein